MWINHFTILSTEMSPAPPSADVDSELYGMYKPVLIYTKVVHRNFKYWILEERVMSSWISRRIQITKNYQLSFLKVRAVSEVENISEDIFSVVFCCPYSSVRMLASVFSIFSSSENFRKVPGVRLQRYVRSILLEGVLVSMFRKFRSMKNIELLSHFQVEIDNVLSVYG